MGHLRPPVHAVRQAVAAALAEDLTPLGDLTASLLDEHEEAAADLVPRSAGVLAGTDCATETFAQVDPRLSVSWTATDGDELRPGTSCATVRGPLTSMSTAERTALNFLCHLSGVATLTRAWVDAAAAGGPARIWDTRKTTPGLRALEKAAVRAGGGASHRGNLSEWVLVKDNHLTRLSVFEAVHRSRLLWPGRTVHVEVEEVGQLRQALEAGADAILLDNMSPEEVDEAVSVADTWADAHAGRRALLECSGGIDLDMVARYAATGVDLISTSRITQSAPALDIGLDLSRDLAG